MPEFLGLAEAIARFVRPGQTVALEGFTHLIPHAAGQEIIRQRIRHLTLVRMTPDIIYDQMVGMGCADKLVFSWGGNPGVGSLYRIRDAVERGIPHRLEIEEHAHAAMVNAYLAGASGMPMAVFKGYRGTSYPEVNPAIGFVECPFTGERLTAVRAIRPDVGIVHAQRADRQGNIWLDGIVGIQKEVILASRVSLVTVEEIVERVDQSRGGTVVPRWAVTAVACVPRGAFPSYAAGYYERSNDFYLKWSEISRERDVFLAWMEDHVLSTRDFPAFLARLEERGNG
jgi:glutaconate CoA-transferase subunit A